MILNTIFLVREIRRNEQHDSFINAVTHELKTPIASIRLYLETLQSRDVDEAQRQEFYRLMLSDTDRLLGTVEQVLKAGQAGQKRAKHQRVQVEFDALVRECIDLVRTRHHLQPGAMHYETAQQRRWSARFRRSPTNCARRSRTCSTTRSSTRGGKVDVAVRVEARRRKDVVAAGDATAAWEFPQES